MAKIVRYCSSNTQLQCL